MTREGLMNFGEMFLEVNQDSKNSSTYEFIDAAVKLFKQEPKSDTLDKIKAEIEEIETYDGVYVDRVYVLDIINKYRESEDKE